MMFHWGVTLLIRVAGSVGAAFAQFCFHFTLEYVFYFVLGYWLRSTSMGKRGRLALYVYRAGDSRS